MRDEYRKTAFASCMELGAIALGTRYTYRFGGRRLSVFPESSPHPHAKLYKPTQEG